MDQLLFLQHAYGARTKADRAAADLAANEISRGSNLYNVQCTMYICVFG